MRFLPFFLTLIVSTYSVMITAKNNKPTVTAAGKTFELSITEEQIRQRVAEIGKALTNDYKDKKPVFVCVLKGAVFFYADLLREVDVDCHLEFLKISSYGKSLKSSGKVALEQNISINLKDKHVVLVEDIIDTGKSMTFLRELMLQQKPKSLKIVSFLIKKDVAKISFPIDYIGFSIPSDFVVGYGLDAAQQGRNLKSIYKLAK